MRAFQLVAPQSVELRDVPEPEPAPTEVLLRVTGAGVCHSDLHFLEIGHELFSLPMTLGHEIVGTVVATGEAATGWEAGQEAAVYLSWGCGKCRACIEGADQYCESYPRGTVPGAGIGYPGGMADLVTVPARQLIDLEGLDPLMAAPLTDAALTPYHAIDLSRERLCPSSTVVVVGVGGLGHMAVQILRAITRSTIVAVDTDETRLRDAVGHGADHMVPSDSTAAAEILSLTAGRGADVVLDFVGIDQTLALAADCIASRGQITAVGVAGGQLAYNTAGPPVGLPWGVSVVRPYGGTRRDLQEVLTLARRGAIKAQVEKFDLDSAAAVLEKLSKGEINGRAVLVP